MKHPSLLNSEVWLEDPDCRASNTSFFLPFFPCGQEGLKTLSGVSVKHLDCTRMACKVVFFLHIHFQMGASWRYLERGEHWEHVHDHLEPMAHVCRTFGTESLDCSC